MFSAKHHNIRLLVVQFKGNLTATISLSPRDNCVDNLVRLAVRLHLGETKHKFAYHRRIGGIIRVV